MTAPTAPYLSAVSRRAQEIAPFHVMELMARAAALEATGHDIVHMEVGEPDFPTPAPVVEAARDFLASGHVHYTSALGLPRLREAIAGFYQEHYGIALPASRVVVTAGGSGALLLALGALVNPGDEWLVTDPGYPCNRHFIRTFEGQAKAIVVGPENRFQPTPEQVASHWTAHTRGALFGSPSNPTGTVLRGHELRGLTEAVESRGGTLILDEIYHGLTYGGCDESVLTYSQQACVVQSFSKYFNMTGWRLGWLIVPEAFIRPVEKLAQNLFIAPSTPAQHAALAAFLPETRAILEARRTEFRQRRDFLLGELLRLGFTIPAQPEGAFYIYADISAFSGDSFAFASRLLDEAGIAATPGLDFGNADPARYMRFAYTTNLERLAEGIARLEKMLGR
ncbi:hypothetical protein OTERR_23240 [Oryzomicrobium terrae]|uniref:Aminotransferase n=1 Tax=Oryzomicrobium terrae TaxID=1735038 RepID=A0A5C1EA72_9RHOO|nr:pyridoxal phosphate-dependent aminotransferase [Oryzomicrobium terrae]QEL65800.1 hypothetical protein OTERR_23240 [Oryzomicrobium terrae]